MTLQIRKRGLLIILFTITLIGFLAIFFYKCNPKSPCDNLQLLSNEIIEEGYNINTELALKKTVEGNLGAFKKRIGIGLEIESATDGQLNFNAFKKSIKEMTYSEKKLTEHNIIVHSLKVYCPFAYDDNASEEDRNKFMSYLELYVKWALNEPVELPLPPSFPELKEIKKDIKRFESGYQKLKSCDSIKAAVFSRILKSTKEQEEKLQQEFISSNEVSREMQEKVALFKSKVKANENRLQKSIELCR